MKKLIIIMSSLLIMANIQAAMVVGKVNIQKVLMSITEGKRVTGKLKKEFDKRKAVLSKGEKEVKKMQQDYKKQSLVMNDKAKRKKEQDIQKKIIGLQQQSAGFQREIQGMEQKLKKPILLKIQKIVRAVSKKAGVEMTFEASTAPIIYAKTEKDLTNQVIKSYNSAHK